jgi:hypothetical protein
MQSRFAVTVILGSIVDQSTLSWLDGMATEITDGQTHLHGILPDQPALFGFLNRIRDLNLVINRINIIRVGDDFQPIPI